MKKLVIRTATEADAVSLAPRLREADREELVLSAGPDVEGTLKESISRSSESFAAEEDGMVIALWGLGLHKTWGIPWLVGSDEVLRHSRLLVTLGKEAVSRWESRCELLTNITHKKNTIHHRWLSHIGFAFFPEEVSVGGSTFLRFYRYCPNV